MTPSSQISLKKIGLVLTACQKDQKQLKPDITEDASILGFLRTGACDETGAALAKARKRAQHHLCEGTTLYERLSKRFVKRKVPAKAERIGIIIPCHSRCGHFGVSSLSPDPATLHLDRHEERHIKVHSGLPSLQEACQQIQRGPYLALYSDDT